jgi:hypothetical protein
MDVDACDKGVDALFLVCCCLAASGDIADPNGDTGGCPDVGRDVGITLFLFCSPSPLLFDDVAGDAGVAGVCEKDVAGVTRVRERDPDSDGVLNVVLGVRAGVREIKPDSDGVAGVPNAVLGDKSFALSRKCFLP